MKAYEFDLPDQFLGSNFYEIYKDQESGQKHIRFCGKITEWARAPNGYSNYACIEYENIDMRLSRFLLEMDDAEETGRFTEWYEKLFKKQDDPKIGFESAETVLENLRDRYEENEIRCKPIQELVRDNPVGVFVDRKSFAMQKEIAHKETQQQRLQRLFAKYLVDEDAPEKRKGK